MTPATPTIPTAADLGSDRIAVRAADLWSPPGLTNFLGTVQVDRDLMAIRALYAAPLWAPDVATGHLYVDGQFVQGTGTTLHVTWYPDAIVREVELGPLRLTSTTFMAVGNPGVVVHLAVTTTGPDQRVRVRLRTDSRVRREVLSLREPFPPGDPDNQVTIDRDRSARVATSPETGAVLVQGLVGDQVAVSDDGDLDVHLDVSSSGPATTAFVVAMGPDDATALRCFDDLAADVDGARAAACACWDAELAAIVTPGNDRYAGHLPALETDDHALWRLYWTGILGVVMFRRDNPASVLGRTYDTLMPRFWPTITFLWDYSLSSGTHALLDPDPMRRHLEHWMATDVHTCMGTCWLTGEGVGMWYAVNDYAMIRLVDDYVRWTGDVDWLTTPTADGRTPLEHVVRHAQSWRDFQTPSGLADYGGIGNLLECVSTYVHEVASLNAANAWGLRTAATLLERHGDPAAFTVKPGDLRDDADEIVARLRELYVPGQGHFAARFPDGRTVPVRHCYDLLTVLDTIPDDIADLHDDLVAHWEAELRTDRWMRALSIRDRDAPFSVRADHQWNGAYTAWPSEVAAGLYRIGRGGHAAGWLRTMAASANQGPFGQAHFAEGVIDPVGDGARKVPPEEPYINDWACSSGGSWVELVINGIFGVATDGDTLTASPQLDGFDRRSRLRGLSHRGRLFDITVDGAVTRDPRDG